MKLRCKGCQKKIELSDYNCPFCGKVNFSTDEEVRAAYNRHVPKGAGAAAAGVLAAVSTTVGIFIIIISVIISAIIISVYSSQKANNDWAFEHVAKWTEFDKANSSFGGRFEFTRVYSESAYPYYEMYITYDGEPEDFIRESVSLCDMLYRYAGEGHSSYRDELTFKLMCGEMMFNCERSRYVETNVLFDYSELELFGLKSLTVHTDKMTDEEKQRLKGTSYPFVMII